MKDTLRQTANLVTVLIALTVNILASALPLNGQNTGEISDRFQVYFVPAGYVFAIWFFIYVGWIAFAIYQFRASQKESPRLRRLGYLFAASNLVNAAWLFTWHYNVFGLSVLVMLSLLGLLIASYLRLDVNRVKVTRAERWSVDIPFSIYLGWITVATVANVTDWLYLVNWNGFGIPAPTWAVIMIGVASVVGLAMTITRQDAAYLFVLVWSFIGIAVKQTPAPNVVTSAWIGAVLMFVLAVYSLTRRQTP
ncbi:MAG: tryptophan-rich sensory protein [Anaerolineales bacterium]|nr:MAG: tryptophan-rich sensory protein [Anaerolineales bacterium]